MLITLHNSYILITFSLISTKTAEHLVVLQIMKMTLHNAYHDREDKVGNYYLVHFWLSFRFIYILILLIL